MVEGHFQECEDCSEYLQALKTDFEEPLAIETELEKAEPLKKFKKRLLFKNIKVGTLSAIIAFVVLKMASRIYMNGVSHNSEKLTFTNFKKSLQK